MVNFTTTQIRNTMDNQKSIRNITVIAHVDHGKTTLTDSLVAKAGIISQDVAGQATFTDIGKEERERGITIKSTGVSLFYSLEGSDESASDSTQGVLVNLIDSPGHIDFSAEVTAALRVTDGALVVVDVMDGVCVQTEMVLRQALADRIKPVVVINKIDKAILSLEMDPEELYQKLVHVIDNVNAIISTYNDENGPMGDLKVSPSDGTVCFASGLFGFGFTLTRFAKILASQIRIEPAVLMKLLWGDNYWDPVSKTISRKSTNVDGTKLTRSFVEFILKPVQKFISVIREGNPSKTTSILSRVGVKLHDADLSSNPESTVKIALKKWLPLADSLIEMIINHLPSPDVAQKYRTDLLYTGPLDDTVANSIRNCDPNGPLVIFISKMVPTREAGRFYAFGRVFSGTITSGMHVSVLGTNYVHGARDDLYQTTISKTVVQMGGKFESIDSVPSGNTLCIVGIDKYILKTATITTAPDPHPMKSMKFSVSPVVRAAVAPIDPSDLPKLIDGMNRLAKSDPAIVCTHEQTGEHIVAAAGELHLDVSLRALEEEHARIKIKRSPPVVSYRETITDKSSIVVLAKSPNGLNRLLMTAEPLSAELVDALEAGKFATKRDQKALVRELVDVYNWDLQDAKRLWCFGPGPDGSNALVDTTKSADYLSDVKDNIINAFLNTCSKGVLCNEPMRGIRFNIVDCHLHRDPAHRGAAQIIPAAKSAFFAAQLSASPTIVEPFYLTEIVAPLDVIGGVHAVLARRRGRTFAQEQKDGTPLSVIKAFLPVVDSFGFDLALREATSGKAFPQLVFDHWENVDGNPFDDHSPLALSIRAVRVRKGLPPEIPPLDRFHSRL